MPLAISIAGLALSLGASIVAVTIALTQMKSNIAFLDQQQKKTEAADADAVREFTQLLVLVKAFIAEQTAINKTVTKSLEGIVEKVEKIEGSIGGVDHRVTEIGAVTSLLAEVLRRERPSLLGE